jgi:Ca2+-binding EF-hand superfamily protein
MYAHVSYSRSLPEPLPQAGEEVTFQRVGEIIGMVDKNSDGEIDFDE